MPKKLASPPWCLQRPCCLKRWLRDHCMCVHMFTLVNRLTSLSRFICRTILAASPSQHFMWCSHLAPKFYFGAHCTHRGKPFIRCCFTVLFLTLYIVINCSHSCSAQNTPIRQAWQLQKS